MKLNNNELALIRVALRVLRKEFVEWQKDGKRLNNEEEVKYFTERIVEVDKLIEKIK